MYGVSSMGRCAGRTGSDRYADGVSNASASASLAPGFGVAFLHVRAGKVGVKMSPLEQAFNCVYAAQLEGHILIPNTYHKDVVQI